MFFLRGAFPSHYPGVFPSHYPNYFPENAVLSRASLVADWKEEMHTDFFSMYFFFPCFAFHFQAHQLAACRVKALRSTC